MVSGGEEGFGVVQATSNRIDTILLKGALSWPKGIQQARVDEKTSKTHYSLMLSYKIGSENFRYCKVTAPTFQQAIEQLRDPKVCKNEAKKFPSFNSIQNRTAFRSLGGIDEAELGLLVIDKAPQAIFISEEYTKSGLLGITLSYQTPSGEIKKYAAAIGATKETNYNALLEALKTAKDGDVKTVAPDPQDLRSQATW